MHTASRTAEHVAFFRALETRRRDRLFADDHAIRFLSARYRWLVRAATVPLVGHGIARLIDHRYPDGPRTSAVARTRLIDDLLTEARPDQVLLLGAGYDSRAHRIPGMPPTYEVDLPATQRAKRQRVPDRPHVHYVPVDLGSESLAAALGGFPGKRTAVIWEGVTNYLTEQAVDATLRDLTRIVARGSTVIFTYVDRSALGADTPWHREVEKVGEPWTFGLHPADVPGYLAERGLDLKGDLSAEEAAARYHRDEPAAGFYRIAWAVVR
ncbi:SAM-dependent methyltransferase [Amycolatopsis sp. DG1A-15b]|uniref:class I SAM-dependent methyltransferase n=1 Tax=Amycolatopsis sp. DG1A-15b TaxID=3052846 RepID=UPI00255C1865|nr:SAM-dependent methyltransferase [Amycolatopsis sp. DG1A-15b]WIX88796.1 SAM-dependent methyltransferase [Amycolatopsis sp. DG1A-15b]